MRNDACYAVIMAGGAGSRLWPLSRKDRPKHFLKLFSGKSLIEQTVDKLEGLVPDERILILTSARNRALAQECLPQIPPENFVYEPCIRDTASAIGLAATVLETRCQGATMIMLTADQIIEPVALFREAIEQACGFLERYPEMLVAFGVDATSPNTKVGWQKLGEPLEFSGCEVRRIAAFTEKPTPDVAQQFLDGGGYCWNSGQFAWKARAILGEIENHLPEATGLLAEIRSAWDSPSRMDVVNAVFPKMPTGSIDYKVMQKTRNACSIRLPCSWDDMGTHAALADRIGTGKDGNVCVGNALVTGKGNRVLAATKQRVVVAASDAIIVVTDDAVFVGDAQTDMKALLKRVGRELPEIM